MSHGRTEFLLLEARRLAAGLLGLAGLLGAGACSSDGGAKALPPPTGHYEGRITYQGADLRAALDLREVRPGQLQADLRFPELQGLGFPAENLTFRSPQLHFERQPDVAAGNMAVDAIREGDFLRGFFTTDSVKADLLLVRRGKPDPRPYREQALRFRSGPLALRGTLLLPDDTLRLHPAVVLLPAADAPRQRALHAYADLLARHGFAAVIYDQRPAPTTGVELPELAADAAAAARAAQVKPGVDSTRVGFWGVGQGGQVAALAAGLRGKQTAFVVALSTVGVTAAALARQQTAAALRGQTVAPAAARQATQAFDQLERYVRRGGQGDTAQLHLTLQNLWQQPWAALTTLPRRIPTAAEIQAQPRWRNLLLDPRLAWQAVRSPVLLLYGAADPHLNARENAQRLRGAVGSRRGSAVRVYANADQALLLPSGVRPDTDGKWDWSRPAPGSVEDMLTWMQQAAK